MTITIEPAGDYVGVLSQLMYNWDYLQQTFTADRLDWVYEVGSNPRTFDLDIRHTDGRHWKQNVSFDQVDNPLVVFQSGNTAFRSLETTHLRQVRQTLDSITTAYPTLTRIFIKL